MTERPTTRVEETAAALRADYVDCPACKGTGELQPGNGCAVCCTTGILPREAFNRGQPAAPA